MIKLKNVINKHKSNKIKENSNTVRHLNNGTDHRHSKSCCDQSSPARRTINAIFYGCYYFHSWWNYEPWTMHQPLALVGKPQNTFTFLPLIYVEMVVEFILMENTHSNVRRSQYYFCWWPGDVRNQVISRHGIDIVPAWRSVVSNRRVLIQHQNDR